MRSRIEKYMAFLNGEDVSIPARPLSRNEKYLAYLAGENVTLPSRQFSRIEKYLAYLCGVDVSLPAHPHSEMETYLARLCGEDVVLPAIPVSRINAQLAIAVQGGGWGHTYYLVTYYDDDGLVLGSESVEEGQDCVNDPTPSKQSTAQYTFSFSGWAASLGGAIVQGATENIMEDRDLYAVYGATLRSYTVTYFDEDGVTLLGTEQVPYGSAAAQSPTPTKAPDGTYVYSFDGWSGTAGGAVDASILNNITGPVSVYAHYAASAAASYTRDYLTNQLTEYESNITDIGAFAFAGNDALLRLSLPDLAFTTGKVPKGCFYNLTDIVSLTIPTNFSAVTEIEEYAFNYFLRNAKMKDANNKVIPVTMRFPNVTHIGLNAFANSGYFHLFFDKATTVDNGAFYWSSVMTLYMPKITSLGTTSFQRYYYLQKAVTLLWPGLTSNVTPTAVTGTSCGGTLQVLDCGFTTRFSAHMRSFSVLETLILRCTSVVTFSAATVYSSGVFSASSPIGKGTGKIYVPEDLVDSYKAATGWSRYADCFTALEGSEYE